MTLVSAADTHDAHRDRIAAVIAPLKPSVPVPAFRRPPSRPIPRPFAVPGVKCAPRRDVARRAAAVPMNGRRACPPPAPGRSKRPPH